MNHITKFLKSKCNSSSILGLKELSAKYFFTSNGHNHVGQKEFPHNHNLLFSTLNIDQFIAVDCVH